MVRSAHRPGFQRPLYEWPAFSESPDPYQTAELKNDSLAEILFGTLEVQVQQAF